MKKNSVKNRQESIVEQALQIISGADPVRYSGQRIESEYNDYVWVDRDGNVYGGIEYFPLTWEQRRTISRAFMRKAKELDQKIFDAGRKVLREKSGG